MKIFLTGASGFIGKNFCDLALKKGHYIFAPTRKNNLTKKKNLKWLKGDFDKNWKNELSKSDLLIHFAASGLDQTSLENVFDVNVFVYHMEGNFGGGKLWRIHYKSIFGKIKFGEFVQPYII